MTSYSGEPTFMKLRRGLVTVIIATIACSAAVFAQNDKKQSDAQKKEIQNIVKIVDGAVAGQPAPNDLALAWVREDLLKAQGYKQYIPFTISIDPSTVSGNVAIYWRVVNKDAAAAPPPDAAGKDDKKKDEKKDAKTTQYAYE